MKKTFLVLLCTSAITGLALAQDDADGCKDHSLLTRLENFYISGCEENYNELELRIASGKTEKKEGNLFHLYYRYNSDADSKAKSALQVIRNYEAAITKNGGKMVYKNSSFQAGDLEATYHAATKEKEYWVKLSAFAGTENAVEAFALDILEMEPMKQEVTATSIFETINKEGFIALYINFETGEATIQPESKPVIDQVASMLEQNPSLKISIEGHTDNTGTVQGNKTLSEARAKAVLTALTTKGISKDRLQSKGWGQSKPVAGNNTEEGRAQNRRVEIVKL